MKNNKLTASIIVAALVSGATWMPPVRGADLTTPSGRNPERREAFQRAIAKLELSEQQREQIRATVKQDRDVLAGLLNRLRQSRNELRTSIRSEHTNESTVRAASAKVAAVEADLAVERMRLYGKISPILTAEQRTRLDRLESRLNASVEDILRRVENRSTE